MKNIFDVRERVVVVTGASSGLGAHFAGVLGELGAKVVLAARRIEQIEQLARKLDDALVVQGFAPVFHR